MGNFILFAPAEERHFVFLSRSQIEALKAMTKVIRDLPDDPEEWYPSWFFCRRDVPDRMNFKFWLFPTKDETKSFVMATFHQCKSLQKKGVHVTTSKCLSTLLTDINKHLNRSNYASAESFLDDHTLSSMLANLVQIIHWYTLKN